MSPFLHNVQGKNLCACGNRTESYADPAREWTLFGTHIVQKRVTKNNIPRGPGSCPEQASGPRLAVWEPATPPALPVKRCKRARRESYSWAGATIRQIGGKHRRRKAPPRAAAGSRRPCPQPLPGRAPGRDPASDSRLVTRTPAAPESPPGTPAESPQQAGGRRPPSWRRAWRCAGPSCPACSGSSAAPT